MIELLKKWRDAVCARLIDDWHKAGRFWSVRLAAIGAALQGFVAAFPGYATQAWNAMPEDLRTGLPATIIKALPFILFASIILSRVTKQKSPTDAV